MSSNIKRKRAKLTCIQCSERKVKCDRGNPCSACSKMQLGHLCLYGRIRKSQKVNSETTINKRARDSNSVVANDSTNKEVENVQKSNNKSDKSEIELLKERLAAVESKLNEVMKETTNNDEEINSLPGLALNQKFNYKSNMKFHDPNFPGRSVPGTSQLNIDDYIKIFDPIESIEVPFDLSSNFVSMTGINPYASREETINLYKDEIFGHTPNSLRRANVGPFAWLSVSKRDRVLSLVRSYFSRSKPQDLSRKRVSDQTINSSNPDIEGNENHQENFEGLESDEDVDSIPYDAKKNDIRSRKINNMNESNLTSGLTSFHSQLYEELQIIERIKLTLPRQKVVWMHFHRFFKFVYPFMPFIDEVAFRKEIEHIIGPEDYKDENIRDLNIERRIDLATIGTLLICLRLSYLSLFFNNLATNEINLTQDMKYLLSNQINVNMVELAQQCLYQFQLFRKTTLSVLQCALLLKIHNKIAPEDGNGSDGGDSVVFNGMLIQMSCSIGLNREPDNFDDEEKDEKANNLGRKIWYYLVLSDFVQSYTFGNPLISDSMHYDTKFPFYKEGNENIVNVDLEKTVTGIYRFCKLLIDGPMRDILRACLDIGENSKMWEITRHLNRFESYTDQIYGKLSDYVNPLERNGISYSSYKIMKIHILLSMTSFYFSMYYYFYIYYEKKKNFRLSFFYLRKMLSFCIIEIMPYLIPLIFNSVTYFGEGASMVINPEIEMMIHRVNEVIIAAVVKVNFLLYRLSKFPNHSTKLLYEEDYRVQVSTLIKLSDNLVECLRLCLTGISKMSSIYYYAWKITKQHGFILQIIQTETFYSENSDFHVELEDLGLNEIDILFRICETGIKLAEDLYLKIDINETEFSFKRKKSKIYQWSSLQLDLLEDNKSPNSNLSNSVTSEVSDGTFNNREVDSIWMQMAPFASSNASDIGYDANSGLTDFRDDGYFYLPFFDNLVQDIT